METNQIESRNDKLNKNQDLYSNNFKLTSIYNNISMSLSLAGNNNQKISASMQADSRQILINNAEDSNNENTLNNMFPTIPQTTYNKNYKNNNININKKHITPPIQNNQILPNGSLLTCIPITPPNMQKITKKINDDFIMNKSPKKEEKENVKNNFFITSDNEPEIKETKEIKKENVENKKIIKKEVPIFVPIPILNKNFNRNDQKSLLYLITHPERPVDKAKAINFNENPSLIKARAFSFNKEKKLNSYYNLGIRYPNFSLQKLQAALSKDFNKFHIKGIKDKNNLMKKERLLTEVQKRDRENKVFKCNDRIFRRKKNLSLINDFDDISIKFERNFNGLIAKGKLNDNNCLGLGIKYHHMKTESLPIINNFYSKKLKL